MRRAGMVMWFVVGCDSGGAETDGPTGNDSNTDVACSTDSWSTTDEGANMDPGGDCITCHASGEGPNYTLAGTVMGDYGDELDCKGIEGVTVRVTDANDEVHELVTNSVGNFYTTQDIPTPVQVELEFEGRFREMVSHTDGNCATCHTDSGESGAPGRIIAP